mmetsp:Transcript_19045/g.54622  ORF Transcript_19045/g.54622 Transcript_19045/m.54622 type:complete len:240 (-) Transcript_19045:1053-1772(-)
MARGQFDQGRAGESADSRQGGQERAGLAARRPPQMGHARRRRQAGVRRGRHSLPSRQIVIVPSLEDIPQVWLPLDGLRPASGGCVGICRQPQPQQSCVGRVEGRQGRDGQGQRPVCQVLRAGHTHLATHPQRPHPAPAARHPTHAAGRLIVIHREQQWCPQADALFHVAQERAAADRVPPSPSSVCGHSTVSYCSTCSCAAGARPPPISPAPTALQPSRQGVDDEQQTHGARQPGQDVC